MVIPKKRKEYLNTKFFRRTPHKLDKLLIIINSCRNPHFLIGKKSNALTNGFLFQLLEPSTKPAADSLV